MHHRYLAFTYGVLAYIVFLVTLAYAVGFLGGVVVPKTVDSGPVRPLVVALLVDGSLIGLSGLQHSVMAREWFKQR